MTSSLKHSLPAFRIRRAVPADTASVQNFVFAALRSYGFEPDPEGLDAPIVAFGTAGEDGPVLEWVAEVSGTVVGAIGLSPVGEDAALSAFYVDSAYRGSGIGRTLLEYVVKEAKAQGFNQLHLETSSRFREAIHLYEAVGWVRGPDLPPEYGPDRTYSLQIL
jgi:GNAT superfamily N-acetyltransferase